MKTVDRVAVVTGGTQGIGRATALALAESGHRVAVLARTESAVRSVVGQIQAMGGVALPVVADVTDPVQVEDAFGTVVGAFSALDVLVSNAGTGIRKPFLHMEPAECNYLIDLNVRGLLNCTRTGLRLMQHRRAGGRETA